MFLRNRKAGWMILCFNQYKKMLKLFFVCFLEWLHYERMSEKSFKKQFSCKTVPCKDWKYTVYSNIHLGMFIHNTNIIHARNELVLNLKHHPIENVKETVTNSSVFVYSIVLCSKTWAHLAQVRRCCWSVCRPVESHVPSCQIHSMPSFRARAALIATQG